MSSDTACGSSPARSARCRRGAACDVRPARRSARSRPAARARARSAAAARVSAGPRRPTDRPGRTGPRGLRRARRREPGTGETGRPPPARRSVVMGNQPEAVTVERQRRAASQDSRTVLAPEPLPALARVEIAHRDAAADVEERGPVAALAQRVDQPECLRGRADAVGGVIAVEVEMEPVDAHSATNAPARAASAARRREAEARCRPALAEVGREAQRDGHGSARVAGEAGEAPQLVLVVDDDRRARGDAECKQRARA